ncbi:MAG: M28 family peptidase [Clostridia bacterium]|nr:M28 family peptidase [Clostridia bacterium]
MTELSRKIFSDYQVRRKKEQKTRFIEFMQKNIPSITVEEGGVPKSRNLIVGDVANAKVIFTAHYDTCAAMPFPNLIMPKNILLSILPILAGFVAVTAALYVLAYLITDDLFISYDISTFVSLLLLLSLITLGRPNKNNANDNTSGVITLVELMDRLSEQEKEKVAFVFFDHEENGMIGSSFFEKQHRRDLLDKLIINFDCVSDGDNIMLIQSKKARNKYEKILKETFLPTHDKNIFIEKALRAIYPSDQMTFENSIAVAALKKSKIGLYMDRIHTKKDVIFDESNIEYICSGMKNFLSRILNER